MATLTKYANAHTTILTGYTNPSNAYTDDTAYATATPAKNNEVSAYWGFPAFTTGDIPDGSTINSVKVTILFKCSVNNSVATQYLQAFVTTTAQGSEQSNSSMPTSDTALEHTVTTITLANLRTADVVRARTRSARGNSNTSETFSIQYVRVTVDYTVKSPIVAAIATASDIVAALKGKGKLIGEITTAPTTGAILNGKGKLIGSVDGITSTAGNLRTRKQILAAISANSNIIVVLTAKGKVIGVIDANSAIVADLKSKSSGNSNFMFLWF